MPGDRRHVEVGAAEAGLRAWQMGDNQAGEEPSRQALFDSPGHAYSRCRLLTNTVM